MNILLGVTGSIAAYKAASVVSVLRDKGHDVRVCMTKAATLFVGPVTFSALSHNPVILDEDEWKPDGRILHIELAQRWADVLVILPATYDFIGKMLAMRADDALSSIYAAWNREVLVCPAMNTVMWDSLFQHLQTLPRTSFVAFFDGKESEWGFKPCFRSKTMLIRLPVKGKLACGGVGMGSLPSTKELIGFIEGYLGLADKYGLIKNHPSQLLNERIV